MFILQICSDYLLVLPISAACQLLLVLSAFAALLTRYRCWHLPHGVVLLLMHLSLCLLIMLGIDGARSPALFLSKPPPLPSGCAPKSDRRAMGARSG